MNLSPRQFSLSELLSLAPYTFSGEHELVRSIEQLAQGFTSNREDLSKYWQDPRLLSAYLAFYFPTNYPKFFYLLNQLPNFHEIWKTCEFVDVGPGPGTYMLAFLDFAKGQSRVVGLEKSQSMRMLAAQVLSNFWPSDRFIFEEKIGATDKKIILNFGHSLNEMGADAAWQLIKSIKPHWIFFIEPGTPSAFHELLKLKDLLIEFGFNSYFPCFDKKSSCPMIGTSNWCHQMLSTHYPPEFERLFQKVKLDRLHMPLMVHVYGKEQVENQRPSSSQRGRIIQVKKETKFSFEIELCIANTSANQQQNELILAVVLKKNHDKALLKKFKQRILGCEVRFKEEKKLAQGVQVQLEEIL